jgi:hypothetical protein
MTYDQARLDAAFARAVREIHEDIANGRMPIDVDTFSRLHDYVDANEYGGLCQIDDLEGDELHDFANTLQNRVNDWLAAGRPMNPDGTAAEPAEPIETLVTIPGWTSATYVGGRIKRIVF